MGREGERERERERVSGRGRERGEREREGERSRERTRPLEAGEGKDCCLSNLVEEALPSRTKPSLRLLTALPVCLSNMLSQFRCVFLQEGLWTSQPRLLVNQ